MRRQLLLDPKPPKRKTATVEEGQVQHVVKKDEWEPPPERTVPRRDPIASAMRRENKHQKLSGRCIGGTSARKKAGSRGDWAPSMHLPEAPEAQAGGSTKGGNGKLLRPREREGDGRRQKAKKVEDEKKAPKKKAKVTSFGPGGGTKMKTTACRRRGSRATRPSARRKHARLGYRSLAQGRGRRPEPALGHERRDAGLPGAGGPWRRGTHRSKRVRHVARLVVVAAAQVGERGAPGDRRGRAGRAWRPRAGPAGSEQRDGTVLLFRPVDRRASAPMLLEEGDDGRVASCRPGFAPG